MSPCTTSSGAPSCPSAWISARAAVHRFAAVGGNPRVGCGRVDSVTAKRLGAVVVVRVDEGAERVEIEALARERETPSRSGEARRNQRIGGDDDLALHGRRAVR